MTRFLTTRHPSPIISVLKANCWRVIAFRQQKTPYKNHFQTYKSNPSRGLNIRLIKACLLKFVHFYMDNRTASVLPANPRVAGYHQDKLNGVEGLINQELHILKSKYLS